MALGLNSSWRPGPVREFILAVVDLAPDALLPMVGAALLEDFIDFDEQSVDWIEEQAARSERFRRALAHVWVWGRQLDAVSERIEHAAGTPLARPKSVRAEDT